MDDILEQDLLNVLKYTRKYMIYIIWCKYYYKIFYNIKYTISLHLGQFVGNITQYNT